MTDDRAALAARHREAHTCFGEHPDIPGLYGGRLFGVKDGMDFGECDTARALALPPDPEKLADAHQKADNALPIDRTPTHDEWAAAIIAAWEAES